MLELFPCLDVVYDTYKFWLIEFLGRSTIYLIFSVNTISTCP